MKFDFLVLLALSLSPEIHCQRAGVDQNQLRIGSFNAQALGQPNLARKHVLDTLKQIVVHYDVVFLTTTTTPNADNVLTVLIEQLNNRPTGDRVQYNVVISKLLGRSSNKEQYAYIFRTDRVEIMKTYQYEDKNDVFVREPYGALVKTLFNTAIPTFFLLGVHIRPDDTLSEMNFMDDVYRDAVKYFSVSNAIIMGDMNADCSYLSQAQQASLDMAKDGHFKWLSAYNKNRVQDTSCDHNSVIVAGEMSKFVPQDKVEVKKYEQVFSLSHQEPVQHVFALGLIVQGHEEVKYHDRLKRDAEVVNGSLNVAAFNIQIFGTSKYSKPEVVTILSQIVRRYDIILIQEIRDVSGTVIVDFLNRVNQDASSEGVTYAMDISQRLGTTNSKEEYAYMYRNDTVQIVGSHQYNDSGIEVFEREPYSVLVKSIELDIPDTILIGLHSRPSDVVAELNQLVDVYEDAVSHFGTTNALILGDLNADCSYLSPTRYNSLRLVTDSRFTWLINSTVDTTTRSSTDCAYDRFIVTGGITGYIPKESAVIFRFDTTYSLTEEQAIAVSDHYPIECIFQGPTRESISSCDRVPTPSISTSSQSHLLASLELIIVTLTSILALLWWSNT